MNPAATPTDSVARLRLVESATDADNNAYRLVVALPDTHYQLHLISARPVTPGPNHRVKGIIRCAGWKLDYVSAGGAFIEPIMGRPRRVQGRVLGSTSHNALVIEIADTPIVTELPPRWTASAIAPGTRVGVDVYDGATFEPAN